MAKSEQLLHRLKEKVKNFTLFNGGTRIPELDLGTSIWDYHKRIKLENVQMDTGNGSIYKEVIPGDSMLI